MFSALAMALIGNDDEDFVEISGGYDDDIKRRAYGRENVLPKYTIRIGDFQWTYLNFPLIAGPLGLIGNMSDSHKIKHMDEEEMSLRMVASLLFTGYARTFTMVKDTSIGQGIGDLLDMITSFMAGEEGAWERAGKKGIERYLGFAAKPLPQNINLIRQMWKWFDPTSYSKKELKDVLSYVAGLEKLTGRPTIDQLGEEVKTYPGETLVPYTHWFDIKEVDDFVVAY
jgi:hypothetical protein